MTASTHHTYTRWRGSIQFHTKQLHIIIIIVVVDATDLRVLACARDLFFRFFLRNQIKFAIQAITSAACHRLDW